MILLYNKEEHMSSELIEKLKISIVNQPECCPRDKIVGLGDYIMGDGDGLREIY